MPAEVLSLREERVLYFSLAAVRDSGINPRKDDFGWVQELRP